MKDDDAERQFGFAARKVLSGRAAPTKEVAKTDSPVGKRGRHVRVKVTMNLDGDLLEYFKKRAEEVQRPYQLLINDALRESVEGNTLDRIASAVRTSLVEDPAFISEVSRRTR